MRTAAVLLLCWLICLPCTASAQSPIRTEKSHLRESERKRNTSLMNALATPPAAHNIDVTYYRLNLTVRTPPQSPLLAGSVLVKAISRSDTLRHVPLDLSDPMAVDSVVMNGARLTYARGFSLLMVRLDTIYAEGEIIEFTVHYRGVPDPSGFGSFVFAFHSSTPWVWSLSQPYGARDWWPCKDHPVDKADSVDILVTCDARFKVGSNGRLLGIVEHGNGTHTYAWSERYPIATYLVSVALTDFVEFSDWFHYGPADSMEVLNYVLPEQLPVARASLAKTVGMLEIFSRLFGLYPFINEKYGHAAFGRGGAMEHQTMTSTTTFDESVIAHELAHQWFGDLITCRSWRDLWLNEGFATYSEALYVEAQQGVARYHEYMRPIMESARHATGTLRVSDTASVPNLFDDNRVYDKGGAVLHMLRRVLGDTLFFASLREYVADPRLRYGTAVTEDFRAACERSTGRDLRFFFDEWVDGEGFPWYEYRWDARPVAAGFEVTVRVLQKAKITAPAFFVMPLDCRFSNGTWDTTVVLQNDAPDQQFTLLLSHMPATVRLDPEQWVLGEFTNLNEIDVLPESFALRQNYPNPFNPETVIPFDLPRQGFVSLKIYDMLGREVSTIVEGKMPPGHHELPWNSALNPGRSLASGVYVYRLQVRSVLPSAEDESPGARGSPGPDPLDFSSARTMLLLK